MSDVRAICIWGSHGFLMRGVWLGLTQLLISYELALSLQLRGEGLEFDEARWTSCQHHLQRQTLFGGRSALSLSKRIFDHGQARYILQLFLGM